MSLLLRVAKDGSVTRMLTRGLLYSSKKGVNRNWLARVQQPIDFSWDSIRKWLRRKEFEMIVKDQKYVPERHQALGPDLATAHFVVARSGAIKFEGFDEWVSKGSDGKYSLPSVNVSGMRLEAVDMSNTNIMYTSLDNFVNLPGLKYLNLSGCKYVDDWCLDGLVQVRESLIVLDISACPLVTERGIASLHKLRHLKRLVMLEMPKVRNAPLVAAMLEQVLPDCVVQLSTNRLAENLEGQGSEQTPTFIEQYHRRATTFSTMRHPDLYIEPGNTDSTVAQSRK